LRHSFRVCRCLARCGLQGLGGEMKSFPVEKGQLRSLEPRLACTTLQLGAVAASPKQALRCGEFERGAIVHKRRRVGEREKKTTDVHIAARSTPSTKSYQFPMVSQTMIPFPMPISNPVKRTMVVYGCMPAKPARPRRHREVCFRTDVKNEI
jgi:hypothetical protein